MKTLNELKTTAKAFGLIIRKDGKGGYLLTDLNNTLAAPGPMTLEEVEAWLTDLNATNKPLKDILKELRGDRTAAEMAALVGTTPGAWAMYETGLRVPRDEVMARIKALMA